MNALDLEVGAVAEDSSRVLTDTEAKVLCALSQHFKNLRRLARALNTTPRTVDRLVWRSRRTRPSTIAKVRFGLRRAAAEHLSTVHVCEVMQ